MQTLSGIKCKYTGMELNFFIPNVLEFTKRDIVDLLRGACFVWIIFFCLTIIDVYVQKMEFKNRLCSIGEI